MIMRIVLIFAGDICPPHRQLFAVRGTEFALTFLRLVLCGGARADGQTPLGRPPSFHRLQNFAMRKVIL
jgi:hypothetical protein